MGSFGKINQSAKILRDCLFDKSLGTVSLKYLWDCLFKNLKHQSMKMSEPGILL